MAEETTEVVVEDTLIKEIQKEAAEIKVVSHGTKSEQPLGRFGCL